MIDRDTATGLAAAHGSRHLPDLGPRTWRPTRFDGGWLMTPEGDDLRWRTGVVCLVVLDDGSVHQESSSVAPSLLIERYRAPDGTPEERGGDAAVGTPPAGSFPARRHSDRGHRDGRRLVDDGDDDGNQREVDG